MRQPNPAATAARLPIGVLGQMFCKRIGSAGEGARVRGDELDEVGLAGGAGLGEQALQVGLDRGLGDAQGYHLRSWVVPQFEIW